MKNRIILLFFILCCTVTLSAHGVKIGGIFYCPHDYNMEACVTFTGKDINDPKNEYKGDIVIPEIIKYKGKQYTVTTIDVGAFQNCSNLNSVTLPKSIKKISSFAFSRSSLISIFLPNGITKIEHDAFYHCWKLQHITIPNSVTSIEASTFDGCWSLKSIEIPNNVTSIGEYAFYACDSLDSIIIPNSVISIGDRAFASCKKLKSVTIPNSVTKIGNEIFMECPFMTVQYPKHLDLPNAGNPSYIRYVAYDAVPQQAQPPLLNYIENSLTFYDDTRNNSIDASEQCSIRFKIENNGKGTANNCEARVRLSGNTRGIKVQTVKLPSIAIGETYEVSIPVTADINTQDGKVTFSIEVYEPNGWGVAPFDLTVATKAYEAPYLQVVDYNVASASGKIRKMEPFTLTFNLQNTKYGYAEQVKVNISLPANVFVMDGSSELSFPVIKSGETKPIKLTLAANNNYQTTSIPIKIDIKEKHGKFAENKQLDIALNATASSSINIAAKDEPQQPRQEIQISTIGSAVDKNIPISNTSNNNTFVVIVANEQYMNVASVPCALNDGRIFAKYCQQTLGIPSQNIKLYENATLNNLRLGIAWLKNVCEKYEGDASVIFYYTGHGIPDEADKTAYLLPVDGDGHFVTTGYKLDDLYQKFGAMPAKSITVLLDACFSGATRDGKMVTQAKGVAVKVRSNIPQGNTVVFSAAQGDETAGFNEAEGHGLFTYYLLKKLQETKGDVTMEELSRYVIREVGRKSAVINKPQTPCVTPSVDVEQKWQEWKLK